ncbi:Ldh family oxidoreductase [Bordetella genomosp. 12]|uniref:Dehydrogenase n=1 Tax=Bordetella genomosp. 12 TaxID=463035 RepID=A0A261V9W1_9BORD|nr:Ldh family oxidoreductase [Bordetella genomosp. 12]OZI70944.1 dehydrogenase [Bordetella genomosp. 12]
MKSTITIGVETASHVAQTVLHRAGVPPGNAAVQTELLIEAELRGRASHGLLRLPRIVERIANGVIDPVTRGESHWKKEALLEVDGMRGLGPVVAFRALEQIGERAAKTGVAAAVIRNNNHIGMLALYAEHVARRGQALIGLSTSEALVHPWGGRRAMLGTNPIAIGVPAEPAPFVMDMATGLISMGKVHDYAHRNLPLEPGWALDAEGEPTVDAQAAKQGAIAPFGQAKGYALGLAFEVLVGSLTASAMGREVQGTLDSTQVCNKGDVFIVMEPASGVGAAVAAYLDEIRRCTPAKADAPVVVPGDGARRRRAANVERGISMATDVWNTLERLAA